jgi:UDP-N-acetylmuramoyl-L-alanyl-D-glutamate--2,6-diaminopimelate ligase
MRKSNLGDLLRTVPHELSGDPSIEISDLSYDSRRVDGPGTLFAAFVGARADGHCFISEAVRRGAVAVLVSKPVEVPEGVSVVRVSDTRTALGEIARVLYDDPSSKLAATGVTGTKGKTTTTFMLSHIMNVSGRPSGLIGTMGYVADGDLEPGVNTTPEAADLQGIFYEMVKAGKTHVAVEASSHGIALGRVAQVDWDVGVFTNIGHDHLDFHLTVENYVAAKASFFRSLGRFGARPGKVWPKVAVINLDDPRYRAMVDAAQEAEADIITYSAAGNRGPKSCRHLGATDVVTGGKGISYVAHWFEGGVGSSEMGSVEVRSSLIGGFNISNSLAAIGAAHALGVSLEDAARAVAAFPGVPGRFEAVDEEQDFAVIVDYAHTPDSLANVLKTAREIAKGRVICIFGCGGDRDRSKRPIMGRIAQTIADYSIVTSDNPRSEDPADIVREITKGMLGSDGDGLGMWKIILDRREAICEGIRTARPGDVVLIAGKGHETYQILDDRRVHFDDREEARAALRELRTDA